MKPGPSCPESYLSRIDSGSGYSILSPILDIQLLGLRVQGDRERPQEVRVWARALS